MQLVDEYDTDTLLSGPGYGGNFGLFINWGIDTILASDENNGLFIFSFTNLKTGVENVHQKQNDFKLYPNPSNGIVNVDLNENLTNGRIQIYSASGNLLKELPWTKNVVFNTKEWRTGMYYLTITTPNSAQSQPFYIVK